MQGRSVTCPHCATALRIEESASLGRRVACPNCQHQFNTGGISPISAAAQPAGVPPAMLLPPKRVRKAPAPGNAGLIWVLALAMLVVFAGAAWGVYSILQSFKPQEQAKGNEPPAPGGNADPLPLSPPKQLPDASGTNPSSKPNSGANPSANPAPAKNETPASVDVKKTETPAPVEPKKSDPPATEPKKTDPPATEVKKDDPPLPLPTDPKKNPPPPPPTDKKTPDDPIKNPLLDGQPLPAKNKKGDEIHTVLSNAKQKKVNDAVERGVKFLLEAQLGTGSWGNKDQWPLGMAALPALTLLESGVPANNKQIQLAADFVRQQAWGYTGAQETYELSLAIIFLDRLGDKKKDQQLIQFLALRLIAAQKGDGGWSYQSPKLTNAEAQKLFNHLQAIKSVPCYVTNNGFQPVANNLKLKLPVEPIFYYGQQPILYSKPKAGGFGGPGVGPGGPGVGPGGPAINPGGPAINPGGPGINPGGPGINPGGPGINPGGPGIGPGGPEMINPNFHKLGVDISVGYKFNGSRKDSMPMGLTDHSNLQFAMMAVWVSRNHGIPVDKVMAVVDQRFLSTQNDDGGWGYQAMGLLKNKTEPTMSCAGMIGLGLGFLSYRDTLGPAFKLLPEKNQAPKNDPSIDKGLKYIRDSIGTAPEDWSQPVKQENLYLVWSIERVAMLYNLKEIEDKEWYPWAAHMLVVNQQPNGSWINGHFLGESPTVNTCLSLLVLKRANLVKDKILLELAPEGPIVGGDK